jgi:hypothetical protein
MDPVTLGLVVAGTTALVSAGGAVMQGSQASSQAKTQAAADRYEATLAQQQAKTDLQIGASQEGAQLQRNAQVEGTQQAAIAQSGTGVTSPSAQDVMRQTAINAQLDALNIRYEGQLNAHGEQVYAQEARTSANISDSNASNALMSGYLGAGKALLSTGTTWYTGGFGPTPSWMPQLP